MNHTKDMTSQMMFGSCLNRIYQASVVTGEELLKTIGSLLMGSFGYCALGHHGETSHRGTVTGIACINAFAGGETKAHGKKYLKFSWTIPVTNGL